MKIIKINPNNPELHLLQKIADVILKGGVIGYPTETVYGLGTNALNNKAVDKVFQFKQRDKNKAILVIASDLEQIKKLIADFPKTAKVLANHFWPGPLTIIFKASHTVNKRLLGFGNSIGIRIPDSKICLELLKLCGVPITSTSANVTGRENPISFQEVISNFGNELDAIIDGGIAPSRIPSTVIDLTSDVPILKREGVIHIKEIKQIIGNNIR